MRLSVNFCVYRGRYSVRSSGSRLCFAIADNAGDDEVWMIHYSTEADTKSISELATFVNTSWGLCINMTGLPSVISLCV